MFCRNCGTKFDDGNKFCPSCGTVVVAEMSSAPAATVADVETKTVKKPAMVAVVFAIISILMYLMPWITVPSGTAFEEGWFFLFNMHSLIETMPYADSVMVSFIIALFAAFLISLSAIALYVWYIIGEFRRKNNPLTLRLASMISIIMALVATGVVISMGAVNEGDIVSYFKEYGNGIGSILENQALISVTVIILFVLSLINMFIASAGKKEEITVPKAPVYPAVEPIVKNENVQPMQGNNRVEPVAPEVPVQPVFEQPVTEAVPVQPVYEQPAEDVVQAAEETVVTPNVQEPANNAQRFSMGGDL